MDRNRRERTSPVTNNRMFHSASATSFPCVRVAHPPADKIRFARYQSVGLAAAQTDCPDRHFSLSATFLLCGFEIVDARTARGQSQLSVWSVGPESNEPKSGERMGSARLCGKQQVFKRARLLRPNAPRPALIGNVRQS